MRIAHPPTCFELHRNINSFLSVIPTIYKLSIEKQIYFAFQSKNTATYHDLRLDNFLYLKSQFAVDLNSKRYMIDYMILIELGNIIQPQSASSNKIIDCFTPLSSVCSKKTTTKVDDKYSHRPYASLHSYRQ
jgi:hypothetical protein